MMIIIRIIEWSNSGVCLVNINREANMAVYWMANTVHSSGTLYYKDDA